MFYSPSVGSIHSNRTCTGTQSEPLHSFTSSGRDRTVDGIMLPSRSKAHHADTGLGFPRQNLSRIGLAPYISSTGCPIQTFDFLDDEGSSFHQIAPLR